MRYLFTFILISFSQLTVYSQCSVFISSINNPSCNLLCNGEAQAFATTGTAPFTYLWSDGTTTDIIDSLCAGTYTVTLTDSLGCSSNTSVTISNPPQLSVSVDTIINATCPFFCNGSAVLSAQGGNAPYGYSWSPAGGTTPTLQVGCPGAYTLIVTDVNGCTASASVQINSNPILTIDTILVSKSCVSQCNGTAEIIMTSGYPPYTYSWSNGATPSSLSGLCSGTYTVSVSDSNGDCAVGTVTILSQSTPIIGSINNSNSSCALCIDTMAINITSGSGPFTYTWSNNNTNDTIFNLCAGNYWVHVLDSFGCDALFNATIAGNTVQSTSIQSNAMVSGSTCYFDNDGSIQLIPTGGMAPYSYNWPSSGNTTSSIFNLPNGNYVSIIEDANGECRKDTFNVPVANCGEINGKVYYDLNYNCMDNFEPYNRFAEIQVPTLGWTFSVDGFGNYSKSIPYGSYNISHIPNATNTTNYCNNNVPITISAGTPVITTNFGDTSNYSLYDDYVNLTSWNNIVLGRKRTSTVWVNNSYINASSGIVYYVLNPNMIYISAQPAPDSISNDTIYWNYTNLSNNSHQLFYVSDSCPALGSLLGQYIKNCAGVYPSTPDHDLSNNHICDSTIVTGSWDPNDKSVIPEGAGPFGEIFSSDSILTYTIRFQNTGNAPAEDIFIMDTLSSWLNYGTFQIIEASHTYSYSRFNNVVRFEFNNIYLPDSVNNEPASHGYLRYKIHLNNNTPINSSIENTAYIYFDFNPPIQTNTTINTLTVPVSINENISKLKSVVYPNPFSKSFTLEVDLLKHKEILFNFYDVTGKQLFSKKINSFRTYLNIKDLPAAFYYYELRSTDNILLDTGKIIAE